MLFNSHVFLFVFLPLLLAGWFFLNSRKWYKLAQGYLIGMSLWFYAYFNVNYLWIMLGSCLAGYLFCTALSIINSERARRRVLAAGCFFHIGSLGYFKYTNFFLENVNAVCGTDIGMLEILLPVGISFYTFQQLAYLIDCYRKETRCCSFVDYLTFMVYFPQVLQGPILLHQEILPQLHDESRRCFDAERFGQGIQHFVIGLSKKVLLADLLAGPVNYGYANIAMLDSVSAIFVAVGYLFELYFDFSGYCDMAVGLGKMIGIEVAENFDSPFHSSSVKEFWRRWHITLGRFFTKYVYIPLGGSRKGKLRTVINTLIIFLLSGLWHGASWTFVFWGLLHGIGVAAGSVSAWRHPGADQVRPSSLVRLGRQLLTFAYVCLAFVFFKVDTIADGFTVIGRMFQLKWNGFLFDIAENLKVSELYIVTKIISMKAPALLGWVNLALLLAVSAICIVVIAGHRAADCVKNAALTRRYAFLLALLFSWSVISMAGVSTFMYFSF